MTEELKDDRIAGVVTIPELKVTRLQEHPYDDVRYYCVMQRMLTKDGKYAGWKHVSKGYAHSTSAFAALGRIIQKHLQTHFEDTKRVDEILAN